MSGDIEFNCPVCYDEYKQERPYQPQTMNCGHSICEDCCNKINECPICRVVITSRIINFSFSEAIEQMKRQQKELEELKAKTDGRAQPTKQDVKVKPIAKESNVNKKPENKEAGKQPAENTWVTVKHGDPFPPGAMRILGRELVGNDVITKNCVHVAFWRTEDKYPVFGRARNNNGTVEAWFPLLGEHHSVNLGQFLLMTNTNQLSYRWVHPGNLENPKYCPVKVGGYCPAIVTWNGMEILGKAKLPMKIALTSYGGEEQRHEGDTYNNCLVLVRDV